MINLAPMDEQERQFRIKQSGDSRFTVEVAMCYVVKFGLRARPDWQPCDIYGFPVTRDRDPLGDFKTLKGAKAFIDRQTSEIKYHYPPFDEPNE